VPGSADELVRCGLPDQTSAGRASATISDILRYAHHHGITTCVSTNGTLLDDALVAPLLEMAPVYLQVSLDGACAETNDAIRGRGTFDRIVAGIELLAEKDYPDFSLNMVVTRLNATEVGDFDPARRYGAKTRLSRFRPSGRLHTWRTTA
jgi:MoaA/NifB/PqqE/SkfB family radical SAM enzyme